MLLIKTILKDTGDRGIGLFSDELLPIGTVWHMDETDFDKEYPKSEVLRMGMQEYFYKYATYDKGRDVFYLCSDNARFVNHSDSPNTTYIKDRGVCVTIKEIVQGEEITCDYREICDDTKENGFDFKKI